MLKKTLLSAALTLSLVSCAGGTQEETTTPAEKEFSDATPDPEAFEVSVTGDAASEGTSSSALSGELGQQEQGLSDGAPEYLVATRNAVKGLNAIVKASLVPVVEIIKSNPQAKTGDSHTWGPKDQGNATFRFTMKKAADKKFGWKLEGKAKGAADAEYKVVLAGAIQVSAEEARRGRGVVGIDADALAALDPSVKARGQLLCGFAHAKNKAGYLTYALKNFTVDNTSQQPVSALFKALRGPAGATVVRFATHADFFAPQGQAVPNTKKELLAARVRWLPTIGGRADAILLSGDLPEKNVVVDNSCWNAQLKEGYRKTVLVDGSKNPAVLTQIKEEGTLMSCGLGLRDEKKPPEDPMAEEAEDKATAGVDAEAPPAVMPDGSGK